MNKKDGGEGRGRLPWFATRVLTNVLVVHLKYNRWRCVVTFVVKLSKNVTRQRHLLVARRMTKCAFEHQLIQQHRVMMRIAVDDNLRKRRNVISSWQKKNKKKDNTTSGRACVLFHTIKTVTRTIWTRRRARRCGPHVQNDFDLKHIGFCLYDVLTDLKSAFCHCLRL